MAAVVDTTNSPARVAAASNSGTGLVTASFTAASGAFLVAIAHLDGTSVQLGTVTRTISDSGGLTWTEQVVRLHSESTDGGLVGIYTAITVSAVARTVTWNPTWTTGTSTNRRKSLKVYAVDGVDIAGTPVDTVGAGNEGGSSTNNLTTTSITPGATGLLFCGDTEFNQLGVLTSSDLTIDTADYAGEISVASGYKTSSSGVGVTGNLNAGGASSAQHKWVQVTVREAGGGGGGGTVSMFLLLGVG